MLVHASDTLRIPVSVPVFQTMSGTKIWRGWRRGRDISWRRFLWKRLIVGELGRQIMIVSMPADQGPSCGTPAGPLRVFQRAQ
jgi:hypothetical protein